MGESQELDLPLGFLFLPTDMELLEYYLIPKLKGDPLPANMIGSLDDIYKYDPDQIPLDELKYAREKEGHFFTQRSSDQSASARATPSGNWIICKENIPICRKNNEVIGFKNKFLFSNIKDPIDRDQISYWKIVEYRCNPDLISTSNKQMENLVICKVLHKTRVEKEDPDEEEEFEF
ncbi:NAC domain-containing protein 96-like [Henckelia pumila]|uniref:NAC domain-containing protein 96-like n=1 Tax=Henckelia pumila TaxID=405737 RepID=UPI003C6E7A8A